MTITTRPAQTLRHDERIRRTVVAHIVPGFAEAFPASVAETVGVIADLRDRHDAMERGCIAGIGRD